MDPGTLAVGYCLCFLSIDFGLQRILRLQQSGIVFLSVIFVCYSLKEEGTLQDPYKASHPSPLTVKSDKISPIGRPQGL